MEDINIPKASDAVESEESIDLGKEWTSVMKLCLYGICFMVYTLFKFVFSVESCIASAISNAHFVNIRFQLC